MREIITEEMQKKILIWMEGLDEEFDKIDDYCDIEENLGLIFQRAAADGYELKCRSGISKIAFVCDTLNFVIKVPYGRKRNERVRQFGESDWDCCEEELGIFEFLEAEGKEKYFIPNFRISKYGDYPIYIQEKVDLFYETENEKEKQIRLEEFKKSGERYELIEALSNNTISRLSLEWINDAVYYYTYDEISELLFFLNDHGLSDDLHNGNIGLDINNRPVIFDYAGWREDEEDYDGEWFYSSNYRYKTSSSLSK